jgi:tape measure domain-containing protein
MANSNEILISARFDVADLEKQMKTFSSRFRSGLNNALKNLQIDLRQLKGLQNPAITVKVNLDLSAAQKQIDNFRNNIKQSILTIPVQTAQAQSQTQGTDTASKKPSNTDAPLLRQPDIDDAIKDLENAKTKLREYGLTTKEVDSRTKDFANTIRTLQNTLNTLDNKQSVRQAGGATGGLSFKETENSQVAAARLKNLRAEIQGLNVDTAKLAAQTKRADEFMDSFGFRVGILGFGFGILGGYLSRATQGMVAFYESSAKAVEPLQRLQNLLTQDTGRTSDQRENIFNEINRLADLPGGELDSVVKSFRSLASLKLGDERVLQLIEGITKATALSGTGAEGTARLIEQFRQFVQSGVLTERDVRTISEQGGVKITDALTEAFGTTSASTLQEAGPERVINAVIEGLKKLPQPLDSSTDKINRLRNSFNRIREDILRVIDPGMESLINILKDLEGVVDSLADSFEKLSPEQKSAIGKFIVAIPVITGALAGLFTAMSAIGIAAATFNQTWAALATINTKLLAGGGFATIGKGILSVFNILSKFKGLLGPIAVAIGVIYDYFTDDNTNSKINAAFSRIADSFKKIGEAASRAFDIVVNSKAFEYISAAAESILQALGVLVSFLTDALTDAIVFVIDLFGVAFNIANAFYELVTTPLSTDSVSKFASSVFDALTSPFERLGRLLAASFADAVADMADNVPLIRWLGGHTGDLREFADNQRYLAGSLGATASASAELSAETQKSAQTVTTLSEELRELQAKFREIGATIREIQLSSLTNALDASRQRQFSQEEENLARDLRADPFRFQDKLNSAVAQRQTRLSSDRAATDQATLRNLVAGFVATSDQTVINQIRSSEPLKQLDASIRALNQSILAGTPNAQLNQSIAGIQKQIPGAIAVIPGLTNEKGEPLSEGDQKKVRDAFESFNKQLKEYVRTLSTSDATKLQDQMDLAQFTREQQKALQDYLNDIVVEGRMQNKRIKLQQFQIQLQKEEIELQRLVEEDLEGQTEQENKISEIKKNIIQAEKELGAASRYHADFLADQQEANEALLKTDAEREALAARNAARLREQAKAANELYRAALAQATALATQIRDLQSVAIPFGTPRTSGADDVQSALGQESARLQGDFAALLGTANSKFIEPFRAQMFGLFKDVTDTAGTNFESLFNRTRQEIQAALADISNKILVAETSKRDKDRRGISSEFEQKDIDALRIQASKYSQVQEVINKLFGIRQNLLDNELQKTLQKLNLEQMNVSFMQESLELQRQQIELEARQRQNQAGSGQLGLAGILRGIAKERKDSDAAEIRALHQKYALLRSELDIREANLLTQSKQAGATEKELQALRELFAERRKLLGELEKTETETTTRSQRENPVQKALEKLNKTLLESTRVGREMRNTFQSLWATLLSGEMVFDSLAEWALDSGSAMEFFGNLGATLLANFGQAFADTIVKLATEGGKFLEILGKIFGDVLVKLGSLLLQEAIMIPIMAFINALAAGATIWQALIESAASLPYAAVAAATGLALIAAGMAMGGGGGAQQTASSNTAGGADKSTGAQRETFEPNKDPRLVFQKAMMAQITIDIKTDDTQIVKTVIKHVNQNGRLTKLIGNRTLQFGY